MTQARARPFAWLLVVACVLGGCGPGAGAHSAGATGIAARQRRIESHLAPLSIGPVRLYSLDLPDLMRVLEVPGMSVAVIDHFEIAWAKGYGVARAGSAMPVTPRTLFQAG